MSEKNKSKPQITEFLFPALSRKRSDQPVNQMSFTAKLVMVFLVIAAVFVGTILFKQKDISYKSQLLDSLSSLTTARQGTVTVLASQTGLDASVATSFKATPTSKQKTQTRLDYLNTDEANRDIELLDVFKDPYAELPLSSKRVWVSVKTDKDIKSLESLGFPVGSLVNENAHTPLLPFSSFTKDQSVKVSDALKTAFTDAEFIRADEGVLEYQTQVTKDEAKLIVDSTKDSAEPMELSSAFELYQDDQPVELRLRVNRSSGKLVEAELATTIDEEQAQATYQFDYSPVDLPVNPPKSISATKFVNLYLKAVRNN